MESNAKNENKAIVKPPRSSVGIIGWIRENLFSSPVNTILTIIIATIFWFSIIPFTSPVIMLLRIPFGVPGWELALSMVLLVATFIGTTWLAGKIYRVGILMYGKKITYKELWRWLKYSR